MDVQKYIKRLKFARADKSRATGPFESRDEVINFLNTREFFFGDPFVVKYNDREDGGKTKLLLAIGKAKNPVIQSGTTEVDGDVGADAYEIIDVNDIRDELEELAEALSAETQARESADEVLQYNIDAESSARTETDEALQGQIDDIKAAIDVIDTLIYELSGTTESLEEIVGDGWVDSPDSVTITDRIKRDEQLSGIFWGHNDDEPYDGHLPNTELTYASGESIADMIETVSKTLSNVLFEDSGITKSIKFDYNPERNILYYTAGTQTGAIELSQASVVSDAYYDAETEELVIVFNLGEGKRQEVRINVKDLIVEWDVNDTDTVKLSKTRVIDGKDILTANVKISDDADNTLVAKRDGLYVSNSGLTNVEEELANEILARESIKLVELPQQELEPDVKAAYVLDNAGITGNTVIKIYKDSVIYKVYIGHVDDRITSPSDPTVIPGTGSTAVCFIYYNASGEYELTANPFEWTALDEEIENRIEADEEILGKLYELRDVVEEEQSVVAIAINRLANAIVDTANEINANIDALSGTVIDVSGKVDTIADDVDELTDSVEDIQGKLSLTITGVTNESSSSVVLAKEGDNTVSGDIKISSDARNILEKLVDGKLFVNNSGVTRANELCNELSGITGNFRTLLNTNEDGHFTARFTGIHTSTAETYYDAVNALDSAIVAAENASKDTDNSFRLEYDPEEQQVSLKWEVGGIGKESHIDVSDFVKDSFLEEVNFVTREGVNYLEFRFKTYDGEPLPIYVPLSDFAVIYHAGDGIDGNELENNQVVTVKIDPMHEGEKNWLAKSESGLRVTGVTEAIEEALDGVEGLVSGITEELNEEISARTEADEELFAALGEESSARTAADEELREMITAETQAREEEDERLNNLITAETEAREEVDGEIRDEISDILDTISDITGETLPLYVLKSEVEDHLDSGSTLPVQNSAVTVEILKNELVTAAAINELNDRKADKDELSEAVSGLTEQLSGYMPKSGGTFTDDVTMDINKVLVTDYIQSNINGAVDFNGDRIENIGEPVEDSDAATKGYVDNAINDLDSYIGNVVTEMQGIEDVIPSSATFSNQLADKEWVRTVDDLDNYYKKSETYTQAEVNDLIGGIDLSDYMPKSGGTFTGDVNIYKSDLYVRGQITVEGGEILMTDDPASDMAAINKGYVDDGLSGKQDTLVSGTNIKTINGLSIIGSGELTKHLIPSSVPPSKRWIVAPQGVSVCIASVHDVLLLDSDANMNVVHLLGSETYVAKVVEYQDETYLALGEFGDDEVDVFPVRNITELQFNKIDVVSDSDFDVLATVAVKSYQDKLISGTNIKKFAGRSILGIGDVTISIDGDTKYAIFPDEEINFIVWHPGGNGFGIIQTGAHFRAWNYGGFVKHICQISDNFAINVDSPHAYITFLSGSWNGTPTSRAASDVVSDPNYVSYDDNIINADTSNCVKFGEAINASNGYLTIYGDETFALMLIVVLDDDVSTYIVRGDQSPTVSVAKIEGIDSFQYAKRDDENGTLALYHEDSLTVTPILLSGTMPTITDLASASGEEEEIQSFQIGKELPSGGTAGQVLTKASGTDYDVEWKTIDENPFIPGTGTNSAQLKGYGATASGDGAVAEGYSTSGIGEYSHAEGYYTKAVATYSHAEGYGAEANGSSSHAEGTGTIAEGDYSHAEGGGTIANNACEHAGGLYNISHSGTTAFGDSGNTIFSVGIGEEYSRKNAFEVMQNGDFYINGVGGYSGTSITGNVKTVQEEVSGKLNSSDATTKTLTFHSDSGPEQIFKPNAVLNVEVENLNEFDKSGLKAVFLDNAFSCETNFTDELFEVYKNDPTQYHSLIYFYKYDSNLDEDVVIAKLNTEYPGWLMIDVPANASFGWSQGDTINLANEYDYAMYVGPDNWDGMAFVPLEIYQVSNLQESLNSRPTGTKVTSISSGSTNSQIPTAKAVYDAISAITFDVDSTLDSGSTNPVANSAITNAFANYLPLSGGTLTDGLSGTTVSADTFNAQTGFFQTSDERYKIYMNDIEDALRKANSIPTKYFYWKDRCDGPRHIGTSAQKVQAVFPEIVMNDGDKLSLDYGALSIVALAAIKELTAKVDELQRQIDELKK